MTLLIWEPGAAVDIEGRSATDRKEVLHFKFEDSFYNKGKGSFKRESKGTYLLELTATKVKDS